MIIMYSEQVRLTKERVVGCLEALLRYPLEQTMENHYNLSQNS
jgi:hypothetical protein